MKPKHAFASRRWVPFVLTGLAYLVVGRAGMLLALPPGYASPFFPAAGVALAAVLVHGWPAALGVAAGSVGLNLVTSGAPAWVALCIALAALFQAQAGAWLVRRFVRQPLVLDEARDLWRFALAGAVLGCLVNASVSIPVLGSAGTLPAGERWMGWLVWWSGDVLGVLIGAPIALTVIGRPRTEWAPRRLTTGAPMLVVALLLGLGIRQLAGLDAERQRHAIEDQAANAATVAVARLQEPLRALEAMRGVFVAAGDVSPEGFRRASTAWLAPEFGLQALGWSEWLRRDEIAAFEQRVRDGGWPSFAVRDRSDTGAAPAGDEVVAIRYIEPLAANAGALGVNSLSMTAARQAIDNAWQTGRPAATARFELSQGGSGVVVYQAIFGPGGERRGVVFATLRPDALLQTASVAGPTRLHVCLVDLDAQGAAHRLAGAADCAAATPAAAVERRSLTFAARRWEVQVHGAGLPGAGIGNAWPFAVVGLLAIAMLGALLLTVTGRARRIERAVDARTTDLRREVGERQRTEAALRESEQRFRDILDHVPIGVVYTDVAGSIEEANPKLRALLGYGADEMASMKLAELTHPDDRRAEADATRRLLAGDFPMFRRQQRALRKDGSTAWVLAVTSVLRDAAGRPLRLLGVVEDITEHLKLEEAERARERAEAANLAKSDFLSRMSHELRTPLNAMLGFSQLLELDRKQPLAGHQREWTAQIQQAGWHLLHMINDTLDLSRIESGTLGLQIETLDVADLLHATRSLLEQSAQRRNVQLAEALDPRAGAVKGDGTRVKQILTNLLSNAIKYNVEGGRVVVGTRLHDDDTVEIEVRDTGLGMTDAQVAGLFQPFNRLGREESAAEGTGIGLVISQRLAELMGGELQVRSRQGAGSSFRLLLPRGRAVDTLPAAIGDEVVRSADYHQRVVHYVEDNETNAEVMRGVLQQRPQVRLDVSITGLDGLAAIRQSPPSLVLLDMHLPDIEGLELLRHLKGDARTADIPVVVVSADATAVRIREALAAGAAQYVTKPVNVAEMLAVIDEQLEQADTRYG